MKFNLAKLIKDTRYHPVHLSPTPDEAAANQGLLEKSIDGRNDYRTPSPAASKLLLVVVTIAVTSSSLIGGFILGNMTAQRNLSTNTAGLLGTVDNYPRPCKSY